MSAAPTIRNNFDKIKQVDLKNAIVQQQQESLVAWNSHNYMMTPRNGDRQERPA
jgi:hypothetical protein